MKKTRALCMKFLVGIREHGNASRAARDCGITRQAVYKWKLNDPKFAAAWEDAIETFLDDVEEDIVERARRGATYEAMTSDGQVVTLQGKPSDQLAKFILQSRRYKPEPVDPGRGGNTYNIKNVVKLTDAQLMEIAAGKKTKALPAHDFESFEKEDIDEASELIEAAADIVDKSR